MSGVPAYRRPPVAFGMTSFVLGTVGLMLFFFPVVGIPISALAMALGLIGLALAWSHGGAPLRWTLVGIALSGAALAVNIALAYAPAGYRHAPEVPKPWQPPPDRPYVPPPER